jgi:hypothetical protein
MSMQKQEKNQFDNFMQSKGYDLIFDFMMERRALLQSEIDRDNEVNKLKRSAELFSFKSDNNTAISWPSEDKKKLTQTYLGAQKIENSFLGIFEGDSVQNACTQYIQNQCRLNEAGAFYAYGEYCCFRDAYDFITKRYEESLFPDSLEKNFPAMNAEQKLSTSIFSAIPERRTQLVNQFISKADDAIDEALNAPSPEGVSCIERQGKKGKHNERE